MRVRGLDNTGDWLHGKGKSDYRLNLAALAQNLKTRIKSFTGDCFFDTEAGINWFDLLGSKRVLEMKLAISATIINTPEVTSLLELNATVSSTTRQLLVQYSVETIYGRLLNQTVTQEV